MTIVVSGASGFVGATWVRHFLARGEQVVAWEGPGHDQNWRLEPHPALEVRAVDVTSAQEVRAAVLEDAPEVFLHCAAYGAYSSQTDEARIYEVNFSGLRNVLEALALEGKGLRAFIQTGSSSEYGFRCEAPSEELAPQPDSPYAVSKVAGTALVQYYAMKRGLPAHVFRLYSVYGPYEDAGRLIPTLLEHGGRGTLPPLVNPQVSRDFVHTDDVCRAVESLIARAGTIPGGQIFNIGRGQITTLADLVAEVSGIFGITEKPQWGTMPDRNWDHPRWYANPTKAEKMLGWKASIGLRDGLERTWDWMKKNPRAVHAAQAHRVGASGTVGKKK